MRCRLCRLHEPTLSLTCGGTQAINNWQPRKDVKDEQGKDPDTREIIFKILEKCLSKLDCLIFEMLFILELKAKLKKQSDSIRAKVFT